MEVLHDQAAAKFYIPLEKGQEALVRYRRTGNALDLYHTSVPEEFREKGIAEKVVEAAFLYAREKKLTIIPTCPYISHTFLRRRKEFLSLVQPF